MQTSDERLWQAVLSKLQRTERPRLSWAEARGLGVEPEALMAAGWFRYAGVDCEAPDCECGVEPNVEVGLRAGELAVSCVAEPACFRGRAWVPREDAEWLETTAGEVFRALAPANGLVPLEAGVASPFVPVGLLRRRGLEVAVVWLRPRVVGAELLCRGLKAQLQTASLVVLVSEAPPVFTPDERIVTVRLGDVSGARLGLVRALDALDPGYRARASSREHPELDLDFVHLGFSTRPERHVVTINGHEFDGFKQSDVLFTQLLMLAASRKAGRRDGWRSKATLVGDFAPRPSDTNLAKGTRALENLRAELGSADAPGLSEDEVDAIIKVERGTGKLRVGVPPENILLDISLASIAWKLPALNGSKRASRGQEEGIARADELISEVRRLGAFSFSQS
jgi:hypothetical protein